MFKLISTAFINQTGVVSTRRVVGIPIGFLYLFLEFCVLMINLFFGYEVDDFVLKGIDNLGYLSTALLCATIADVNSKKTTLTKTKNKSFFLKIITTANGTISSKKLIGVSAGFLFAIQQLTITFANMVYKYKLSDNVAEHSIGLMFLCLSLLGVDIAKPAIVKIQNLLLKK